MTLAFDWYVDETQYGGEISLGRPTLQMVSSEAEAAETPCNTVTANEFRNAFRKHPAGVAIVTACVEGQPLGLVVSSVISLSAEPAMLAFSVSSSSASGSAMLAADTLVVHLMGTSHVELAQRFAMGGPDRFEGARWSYLPSGEPALEDAAVRLRGRVSERVAAGGSTLILVSIMDVEFLSPVEEDAPGLIYANRAWFALDPGCAL